METKRELGIVKRKKRFVSGIIGAGRKKFASSSNIYYLCKKTYIAVKRYFIYFSLVISFLISFSCKDDESLVPNSEVYVKTRTSEYSELRTPNHVVVFENDGLYPSNFKLGYGGVAIFRDLEGKLGCCDLACPNDKSRMNPITISMPFATCPLCGSKFDLSYSVGNAVGGTSNVPLRMYRNIRDTGEYIVVTN